MLESHTEKLAELCETPLAKVDRTEVINFTRVTKKFMSNILESVHNDTALDMSMMSESKAKGVGLGSGAVFGHGEDKKGKGKGKGKGKVKRRGA